MASSMEERLESATFSADGRRGARLDKLLVGTHRDDVLRLKDQYLSDSSNVEVFEAGQRVSRRAHMNDDEFIAYLQEKKPLLPEDVKFRIVFIPDQPGDTDGLQLSCKAYKLLLDRFEIGNRFSGMIQMQLQPIRLMEYDHDTMRPMRMQYAWSHIVRKIGAAINPKDATKSVLDWHRLIVWTAWDFETGTQDMVVLRCPVDTQNRWLDLVGDNDNGHSLLLRFPMLTHAYLVEDILVRSKNFSQDFAAPIYRLERKLGHTALEFTQNGRRFLTMSRQIGNVLIDYDIVQASLKLLQEVYTIIKDAAPPEGVRAHQWRDVHIEFDGQVFNNVHADFDLLRKYGQLYQERSKTGYAECTALMNQREVEISKQMSAESTIMARFAHQDGQSLRVIQYLGLLFLPLSLCTSVFGMGFFSTAIEENSSGTGTTVTLIVSTKWWWFLALGIPFTGVCLFITWVTSRYSVKEAEMRKKSQVTDLEQLLGYEIEDKVSSLANTEMLTKATSNVSPKEM